MAILAMQRERKLEQRDLDEEKSSTGLENKEKCGNHGYRVDTWPSLTRGSL